MNDVSHDPMHADPLRDAIAIANDLIAIPDAPKRHGAKQGIDYAAIELSRVVGARIRDLRLERGWSLEDMRQRGAPTPTMLSTIERGIVNTTLPTLATIAKALDVTVSQLFFDPVVDDGNDALVIAANIDTFTAKKLLFVFQGVTAEGAV